MSYDKSDYNHNVFKHVSIVVLLIVLFMDEFSSPSYYEDLVVDVSPWFRTRKRCICLACYKCPSFDLIAEQIFQ